MAVVFAVLVRSVIHRVSYIWICKNKQNLRAMFKSLIPVWTHLSSWVWLGSVPCVNARNAAWRPATVFSYPRMVWVGRDLEDHWVPIPCQDQNTKTTQQQSRYLEDPIFFLYHYMELARVWIIWGSFDFLGWFCFLKVRNSNNRF